MRLVAEIDGRQQEFPLRDGVNVIGRDRSCDVVIPSHAVSKRHAECVVAGDRVMVRDLGSRNGTYINGRPVTQAEVGAGDTVALGHVVIQFLAGESVAQGEEIEAPRLEGYTEDSDPTPVDAYFAPPKEEVYVAPSVSAPSPVARNPLARREMPAPAEVPQTIESRPLSRVRLSQREKKFVLIPIIAVAAVAIVGALLAVLLRPPAETIMSHADYNTQINKAVALDRDGQAGSALEILAPLVNARVEGNLQTARVLANAIQARAKMTGPDQFSKGWIDTQKDWEELRSSSTATEETRMLARAQLDRIGRESRNMAAFNEFQDHCKNEQWTQALACAQRVPPDSLFYSVVAQSEKDVTAKVLSVALPSAQEAEKKKDWDSALKQYNDIAAILSNPPEPVKLGRERCAKYKAEEGQIAEARKLIDQGQALQAAPILDTIDPNGPYAANLAKLRDEVAAAQVWSDAVRVYDGGDASRALTLLAAAHFENSDLYQKIKSVKESWDTVEQRTKEGRFQDAKSACQVILNTEKSEKNHYRIDATEFIASWRDKATELARQTQQQGIKLLGEEKYKEARDAFDEAILIDPAGKIGRDDVESMKKGAAKQYNLALNGDPKDQLKALLVVKDMLRPRDPYYDVVGDQIDKLTTPQRPRPAGL